MREAYLTQLTAIAPGVQFDWNGGAPISVPNWPVDGQSVDSPTDWFDTQHHLAGIKHRYLNNATRYGVAAAASCLRQSGAQGWNSVDEERRGVILGSAVADYTVRHQADLTVIDGGSSALNTVSAPNISANIAAAYVAIHCRGRAFSTTMTSPFLAGFESLFFAVQSLNLQRTDAVLAVAAEESLPAGDATQVLPGSVVAHLQTKPAMGGRRIASAAWGYVSENRAAPSAATHRFLSRVAQAQRDGQSAAQIALLRDASSTAASTVTRWSAWLGESRVRPASIDQHVFDNPGTVEPMVWASHWLTLDRPTVLIAIHQRRYLAFLLTR